MRRRDHNIFANAFSLLICGLLAGVVVAAAAFPAVAMSGLAAKAGGQTFQQLPSELKSSTAPQITRILASDNKTPIAVMYDELRKDVPLKDISVNMQNAIIAAEDSKFYKHNGVDVKGIARAFVANNNGSAKQGASTLTMQYVRMSLAYSATKPQEVVDATKDTPKRKITEMRYALQVEKELTKQEILERYLNIAPFGNGAYGVYAASQVYFSKLPKNLTIAESALLASLVKGPSAFNPATASGYPQALNRRNNYVIPRMVETGAITAAQAEEAKAAKLSRKVKRVGNGCVNVSKNNWGFFCDYFYRWWNDQPTFGQTPYDRERRLKSGGYRVVTTLDVKAQASARKRVSEQVSDNDQRALMVAAVQPNTGRVRALAVNRKYKLDDPANPKNKPSSDPAKRRKGVRGTHPNTTNPLLTGGGDITGYQGGSVFKIFTIVAALEQAYPLATTINAQKKYKSGYIVQRNSPAACPGTHFYCPGNSNEGTAGVYNMWSGFGSSVNTYFVPLQERVGAEKVVDAAKRMGIKFRVPEDAKIADDEQGAHQWGAFTLGVSATTPLDLANAYATLAGDGNYCEPIPVQRIQDMSGAKLDVANPRCKRVMSADVARAAIDAARCPVGDQPQLGSCSGGATARATRSVVGHPVFGKTGTTDSERTASLVSGTTSLVVAAMMADPDWPATTQNMKHPVVNPASFNTLADYMKDKPQENFPKPSQKMAYGDQRSIPDVTCDSIDSARSRLEGAGFEVDVQAGQVDSRCPANTVAGTNPSGRTIKGGFVMIQVSNGKNGAEPPEDEPGGNRRPPGR